MKKLPITWSDLGNFFLALLLLGWIPVVITIPLAGLTIGQIWPEHTHSIGLAVSYSISGAWLFYDKFKDWYIDHIVLRNKTLKDEWLGKDK